MLILIELGIRLQHKREHRTISLAEALFNLRFRKSCIRPCGKHIRNTSTGSLPHIDEAEHLHNQSVARIRYSAKAHLLNARSDITRILENQFIGCASDHHSTHAMVIGVEQTVGQCLANCLMHGSVINAEDAIKFERGLQRLGKLTIHTEKEIKEVARPHAIAGMNTIGPTNRRV